MPRTHSFFWPGLVPYGAMLTLVIIFLLAHINGCANNPVTQAQTLEQKAYALYGTFVIVEEQADQLVQQPSTPEDIRISIANADAKTKPVADALRQSFLDYARIKKELKDGTASQDKLDMATLNLSRSVDQMKNDIRMLTDAVQGK